MQGRGAVVRPLVGARPRAEQQLADTRVAEARGEVQRSGPAVPACVRVRPVHEEGAYGLHMASAGGGVQRRLDALLAPMSLRPHKGPVADQPLDDLHMAAGSRQVESGHAIFPRHFLAGFFGQQQPDDVWHARLNGSLESCAALFVFCLGIGFARQQKLCNLYVPVGSRDVQCGLPVRCPRLCTGPQAEELPGNAHCVPRHRRVECRQAGAVGRVHVRASGNKQLQELCVAILCRCMKGSGALHISR
mmetsp:Transcript_3036/g.8424  ORF Transcript_3036/g.8424 Transcript_3036/m.8424 type:complete len:247 (+) Transcript_3036:134-874(+)